MYLTFILMPPPTAPSACPGGTTLPIRGLHVRILLISIWTVAAVAMAVEVLFRQHVYRYRTPLELANNF